jgi:DNA-binding NarL/FixJ family response regulator
VLIVDDHPAVRSGLHGVIAAQPDMAVVATAATAREGVTQARAHTPALVVVDYYLPDQLGLHLTWRLKALPDAPRVLVYSAYADPPMTIAAIIAGADGIASKASTGDELCRTLHRLADGHRAMPPVTPAALGRIADRIDAADMPILAMLVHGTPEAEIAATLGIRRDWLQARRWAILDQLR